MSRKIFVTFLIIVTACISCSDTIDTRIEEEQQLADGQQKGDPVTGGVWSAVTAVGTARKGAAAAAEGNLIYIYGGKCESGYLNEFFSYDVNSGITAVLVNDIPRAYSAMEVVNGYLYIVAGENSSGPLVELKSYDVAHSSWSASYTVSQTNGPWPPESSHYSVLHYANPDNGHDELFYIGVDDTSSGVPSSFLYKLDISNSPKPKWYQLTAGPSVINHGFAVAGNSLYVFGGYDVSAHSYSNKLWKYSIVSDSWEYIITTAPPAPRSEMTLEILHDALYVFGGRDDTQFFSDMWRVTTNGEWKEIAGAPDARAGYVSFVSGSDIFYYGGYTTDAGVEIYYNTLWKYTP